MLYSRPASSRQHIWNWADEKNDILKAWLDRIEADQRATRAWRYPDDAIPAGFRHHRVWFGEYAW